MLLNKKYINLMLLGFLSLTTEGIIACCSHHFCRPSAFMFNMSSMVHFLQLFVEHASSSLHVLLLATLNNIFFTIHASGLYLCVGLLALFYKILKSNYILWHNKLRTFIPCYISNFMVYRNYFSQNSQAIIPFS